MMQSLSTTQYRAREALPYSTTPRSRALWWTDARTFVLTHPGLNEHILPEKHSLHDQDNIYYLYCVTMCLDMFMEGVVKRLYVRF